MSGSISRREALLSAALGAGALAAGSLLGPAAARAQSEDEEGLRDFLVEAVGRSQLAVLAYASAAELAGMDPNRKATLERLRDQDQAHANALRKALDTLGFDPPDAPDSPEDTGVFDDVEGLDDDAAGELQAALSDLADLKTAPEHVVYIVEAERAQIDYYLASAPGLGSEDLAITSAEIVGSLSQHIVVLQSAEGKDPAKLVAGFAEAPAAR